MKKIIGKIGILICLTVLPANAQVPPPIQLPIQNILQETDVWCWVAVAQQIVLARNGPQNTPPQCAMVATANNTNPAFCCNNFGNYNGNPNCYTTGHISQIQWLIRYYGGSYSSLNPPANPMILYNTLQSGRPIILAVNSGWSGHVVVLTGMTFTPAGAVLHINDPLSQFTQPVLFQNLLPMWSGAIVVG